MNCVEIQKLISQFLDEALEEANIASMFEHLGNCPDCQVFLRSGMRTRTAIASRPAFTAPDDLEERVMGRISARAKPHGPAGLWSLRFAVPLPVAVAVAVVIILFSIVTTPIIFDQTVPHPPTSHASVDGLPPAMKSQLDVMRNLE
jgi:predicted anti-sigma-YlaC factor YlaD